MKSSDEHDLLEDNFFTSTFGGTPFLRIFFSDSAWGHLVTLLILKKEIITTTQG